MMICYDCCREMACSQMGVKFRWNLGHCYSGDVFECPSCLSKSCYISGGSFHDTTSPAIQMDRAEVSGNGE